MIAAPCTSLLLAGDFKVTCSPRDRGPVLPFQCCKDPKPSRDQLQLALRAAHVLQLQLLLADLRNSLEQILSSPAVHYAGKQQLMS
ncbi:hypothetical protein DUI87_15363 [Hirundo rustica rustica]|uniref:Uncharacterized protein n=1 Tax=Hirundo rustica rustica TaxID=333673 RepID=A0A3M0K3Z2_HIRRU|nr:hypothetical protein DUI87_15363 [Hirundo rustica rustica]